MNKRSFVPRTANILGWVVGVLGVIATLGALLDGGIAAGFAAAVGTTFSVIVIFGIGVTVGTLEDIRDALIVRTEQEVEEELPGRTVLLTLERMAPPAPAGSQDDARLST
ncbi:MAG TPA: hypothetical protein VFK85_09290 [Anaeromyxobacteraceae bacterium]|nr:hypothetical protein [Anaeromyxobacteraceae bacterium]